MSRRLAILTFTLSIPLACNGSVGSDEGGDGTGGLERGETGGASTGGASSGGTGGLGGGARPSGGAVAFGGSPTGGSLSNTGGSDTGGAAPTGGTPSVGGDHQAGGERFGGAANPGGALTLLGGASNPGGAPSVGGASFAGAGPGGLPRFVGNITTRTQPNPTGLNYADYWDQITPESAGKWGAVQSTAGAPYNWGTLDAIYDYAHGNGVIFKEHTFIWGSAPPGGVTSREQVIDWIRSFCERYPDTALIDVVNEPPPHTSAYFANVMADSGDGEWQWITNAFVWARQYCPDAVLILNDYDNIEREAVTEHFIDIVNTIIADGAPVDAVGAEAHLTPGSSSEVSPEEVARLLQRLHEETGLPVYITELDFAGLDDQEQLAAYQQYFPIFRDAEFVPGITLWGWIVGATWLDNSGLVRDGAPRPAMTWLMNELDRPVP